MKFYIPKLSIRISNHISIIYICAFLLIVFCNFWLFQAKPIAPLYYFLLMSLVGIPFVLLMQSLKISYTQIVSLICFFYFIISAIFHYKTDIPTVIHTSLVFVFYFLTVFYIKFLNKLQVLNITKWLCSLTFLYTAFEAFWRLTHPALSRNGVVSTDSAHDTFYIFKISSIMFQDSNFVALILIVMTFLSFYIYQYVDKKLFYKFMTIAFAILTILTLSRAAIAAMFFVFLAYYSLNFLKKHLNILIIKKLLTLKLFIFIPIAIIAVVMFIYGVYLFLSDESFVTKFQIFFDTWKYIKTVSIWNLLTGIGSNIDLIKSYFGRGTHCLIPTYVVWNGLIGLFLVFYFWYQTIKETKYKTALIIVPIFLTGFALGAVTTHILYVSLAIITYFEKILPEKERIMICQ